MKINVLLPVAGYAKRFTDRGYLLPKPLLPVNGVPMIQRAMRSLVPSNADPADYRLIFVVRDDHCVEHDIQGAIRGLFPGLEIEFAVLDHVTKGTLCSCLAAEKLINQTEPLVVYTPDVCYESDFDLKRDFVEKVNDGILLTFKANSKAHSYVASADGFATRTAEKEVISNDALVGVYGFRSGESFLWAAHKAIELEMTVNGEYYVAPIYNQLITAGDHKIAVHRVDKMHVLGTPEDLSFYETHVARYERVIKLAICSDHSGFLLKQRLVNYLREIGMDYVDFGTYTAQDSDHYDSIKPCLEYLVANQGVLGIGICHTGQGFNILANKMNGVRSALVRDAYTAGMGRRHNAANFFCLSERSTDPSWLPEIVQEMLGNSFDGGRHATRIQKAEQDMSFIS